MPTLYTGLTSPDANYIHTPLIEIVPVDDDTQLLSAIADIDSYDYVLFTSRYAAKYVGALSVRHTRIVSIGRTTTKALHQIGVEEWGTALSLDTASSSRALASSILDAALILSVYSDTIACPAS